MSTSVATEKEAAPKHAVAVAHAGHGHHDDHGGDPHESWDPDPHFGSASLGKIGMWFFLCSDALSFGGLLLAYGILRGSSTMWHNPGELDLGINFIAGLTFLLICS